MLEYRNSTYRWKTNAIVNIFQPCSYGFQLIMKEIQYSVCRIHGRINECLIGSRYIQSSHV
jgi:hypothetical protein